MALRAGFSVISILLGLTMGYLTGDGEMLYAAVGAVFAGLLSGALVFVEIFFMEHLPARTLVSGGVGFSLGMLLSGMFIVLTSIDLTFLGSSPIIPIGHDVGRTAHFPVSWPHFGRSVRQGVRQG